MGPKRHKKKLAWGWVANTKPEEITNVEKWTAYHLNSNCCTKKSCKKNCKLNPRCLIGLGESDWLSEVSDEKWNLPDDPECERRAEKSFVGLKNLGATCYVNSLLQVWFHNLALRKAIYQWRPICDANGNQAASQNDVVYKPTSSVGHLQLIFAFLELSKRRCIDPSEFVKSLRLNTEEEQDAQEFSELFTNFLENQLQNQKNSEVRNIVQQQFNGEYSYVTTCSKCKNSSNNPSKFFELHLSITDHTEISECIDEFLKEEKLEGKDKYFCSSCRRKVNATRRIKITSMPLVLNLLLLRFIFDKIKLEKQKLNSYVSFPEVLDMSNYVTPRTKCIYDLTAVLIHRGHNAEAGHYVANIKDTASNSWYQFNDENIEKITNLQLSDDNPEKIAPKRTKKPKLAKGHHLSQYAYMLVYTKRSEGVIDISDDTPIESLIPNQVRNCVEKDNVEFEEWAINAAIARDTKLMACKERKNMIKQFNKLYPTKQNSPFEWIPLNWLTQWMNFNCDEIKPVDNSKYLCPHSKLNPDSVLHLKCISIVAANEIYTKYGGGHRLTDSSICDDCVISRCKSMRLRSQLDTDEKFFTSKLKYIYTTKSKDTFWVSRSSAGFWRKLYLGKESVSVNDDDVNPGTSADDETNGENNSDHEQNSPVENDTCSSFNEDIVCSHGKLSPNSRLRMLVSREVWLRFKVYFPNAVEFPSSSTVCDICEVPRNENVQVKSDNRETATEQKQCLLELYQNRNRPIKIKKACGELLYAVNAKFIEDWRRYLKRPSSQTPPIFVDNSQLICSHGGLKVLPSIDDGVNDENNNAVLVWLNEWEFIRKFYTVDREVTVKCECESTSSHPCLVCDPDVCTSCNGKDLPDVFEYVDETIFVRKLNFDDEIFDLSEEISGPSAAKKKRVESTSDDQSQAESSTSAIRRSTRRRRLKGEIGIKMSSNQTLNDLKLKVEKSFNVVPGRQHLSVDGHELINNEATLKSLKICPSTCILLMVDEEVCDELEEGFKGTELMNH